MMGPAKPSLQVPEDAVDSGDPGRRSGVGALRPCPVAVAHLWQRVVGSEPVGEHHRTRCNVRRHESDQRPRRDVRHYLQAHPLRRSTPNFNGTHNDRLINDLPTATQTGFGTSNVGFVDLNPVLEWLPVGRHHRTPQLVQHAQAVS